MAVLPFQPPTDAPGYRQAPHSLEAEKQLLGCILVNNDAYARVQAFLVPDHFFFEPHRRVYAAVQRLIDRGQLADPVTLKPFFERDEGLAPVGGAAYLATLAAGAASIIDTEHYGRTIHDLALRRDLIRLGEDMVNRAYNPDVDEPAPQQIETVESALFQLAEHGKNEGGFQKFSTALKAAVDIVAAAKSRGGIAGVSTGLTDLDRRLGGLHQSDLVILAGRPGMGKTALATTMALNAARLHLKHEGKQGASVAFFSLEMSAEQLAARILSERTLISSEKLRKGTISEDEFATQLVPAMNEMAELPFFIDATGGISIATLRTRARRLKRQHGLGMIVVDYLQLVEASNRNKGDNRVQDVSEVSRGLKALAKELQVPVLALSQLSRAVEQRDDKRPQLSDLRESGAIEQDADVVMFVYRDEYYERWKEPKEGTPEHAAWQQDMEKVHGLADIIIGKNRHGPTDAIKVQFEAQFTRFSDLDTQHQDPGY
jgi:replicative DNA helicase